MQRLPESKNDLEWFKSTLESIAQWHGESLPASEMAHNIERLLTSIESIQYATKEYSVAGLFTLQNLEAILPKLLHENRMILITSQTHIIRIFLHKAFIIFYNPKSHDGMQLYPIEDFQKLAKNIFDANHYDHTTPAPFGFRVFSIDDTTRPSYPLHSDLLEQLPLTKTNKKTSNFPFIFNSSLMMWHETIDRETNQTTALYMAAEIGCIESLKIYLQKTPLTYVNLANEKGMTPACIAAKNGHTEALRLLADKGANLNKANSAGNTPTYLATQYDQVDTVRFLVERDVDLNKANHQGVTPLYVSAQKGYIDMIQIFSQNPKPLLDLPIQASVDILLKHAAEHHREQEVRRLFEKKGVTGKQLNLFTPLHAAIFFGHSSVVRALIAMHFDVHKNTHHNISGFELAEAMNQTEILQILKEAPLAERKPSAPTETTVDISQTPILAQLVQYLTLVKEADQKHTYDHAQIDTLIKKLPEGYCSGLTSLALYGLWLQFQPVRLDVMGNPIPRDDWEWLKTTLETISQWPGDSLASLTNINEIEHLLFLIEFFQETFKYLPISHGELHKSTEDTRERKPIKEYSLAGLLTLNHLKNILPEILHQDRVVLIGSRKHAAGIFLHHETIIFYNSNYRAGLRFYRKNKISQLAHDIFSDYKFASSMPSPLAFRVFSFDREPALAYPSHSVLLANLPLMSPVKNDASHPTALYMAARIGCVESLIIYLAKAPFWYVNQPNEKGETAVYIAAQNGHAETLRLLAKHYADLSQKNKKGVAPIHIATQIGYPEVIRVLAENHVNLNSTTPDGYTPVCLAAWYNHIEILRILVEYHADLDKVTNKGHTASYLAVENRNLEVLRVLVENHADLNKASRAGITPIYLAAQNGYTEAIRVLAGNRYGLMKITNDTFAFDTIEPLLHHKDAVILHQEKLYYVDVTKKEIKEIEQTEANQATFQELKLACQNLYQEASCEQMDLISSLTGRPPKTNPTRILDLPIQSSVNMLLKHAEKLGRAQELQDLFLQNNISGDSLKGFTALHAAIFFGHADVVKELIAMNFDIHRTTMTGNISGLDFAIAMNQVQIIQILQAAVARLEGSEEVKIHPPVKTASAHIEKSHFAQAPQENPPTHVKTSSRTSKKRN